MRYELRTSRTAAKQLASLPTAVRARIVGRIERLREWPEHGQDVKALKGRLAGSYRLRCGDYRVLFEVLHDPKVIVVEQIGPRESIYG
ncbi:MAG: type II toxin-antitoxin system RelE/ParE family toxin [Armatimonadetes bacterium]|nr:type II toxin-antitoxin system RelE/ParE family toxin [Armatimonadota bacterium]